MFARTKVSSRVSNSRTGYIFWCSISFSKDDNLGMLMSIVCSVSVCDECAAQYVYDEIVGLWDAGGGRWNLIKFDVSLLNQ